jgi:hypothetical protein
VSTKVATIFQVPDLVDKLNHARRLAENPGTTEGERAAARRLVGKLEAKLKALGGVEPSGPSVFNDEGSAPRNPRPRPNPFSDPSGARPQTFDFTMFAEFFDGRPRRPNARRAPSNSAYPKAYGER